MFVGRAPFADLILKFVLDKLLEAGLSFYDKYLDTSTTLNKTIHGLSVKYILASQCVFICETHSCRRKFASLVSAASVE